MCQCNIKSCGGRPHLDRRDFLRRLGAAAMTGAGLTSATLAADRNAPAKVRVALVLLANTKIREIWPYPGFDAAKRRREILAALEKGCPGVQFVPVTIEDRSGIKGAVALKDSVDGYLVYAMTLDWGLSGAISEIGGLGKPLLVADEFLGGSGVFLTAYSRLCSRGIPAAAVASTRLADLVTVARNFADLRRPGVTPEEFARRCQRSYRATFGARSSDKCAEDPVPLTDLGECVKRFRQSRFLIVGRGSPGRRQDFLGATGIFVDFAELQQLYKKVDRDLAAEWAGRWRRRAEKVVEPGPEAIQKSAAIYLATLELMKKYDAESVTMNCLGGFSAGKLPAYPCLGFVQILDDGGQGVCEAMPDDTISMIMARILTGRPGYVSDPALDTSANHIVYSHCLGTTRPFGPKGRANPFRIRTLHNRDPRSACVVSMLPGGYMTTSFRTNFGRREMIIHRAAAVGNLDSEYGCRTKLLADVTGDIAKLFDQWDTFGWHRVTVYGDLIDPLTEFAKALGLKTIQEA